jgi:hypothetical protein
VPTGAEGGPQGLVGEANRGHVGAVLRLAYQQIAGDELDVILGTEGAKADEPLVLEPSPSLRANQ